MKKIFSIILLSLAFFSANAQTPVTKGGQMASRFYGGVFIGVDTNTNPWTFTGVLLLDSAIQFAGDSRVFSPATMLTKYQVDSIVGIITTYADSSVLITNGTGNPTTDSLFFVYDAGNKRLGIGLAVPQYNLDVSGTARIRTTPASDNRNDSVMVKDSISGQMESVHQSDICATGWAVYNDTTFNVGNKFTVLDGDTVTLPNNAASKIETQMPFDVINLYDEGDSVITGRDGDAIIITIEFTIEPTSAAATRILTAIDIGGAVGYIYPREFQLTKGNGVDHYFLTTTLAYTLDTWEANGGKFKVSAIGGPVAIWNIRYVIGRMHKAK